MLVGRVLFVADVPVGLGGVAEMPGLVAGYRQETSGVRVGTCACVVAPADHTGGVRVSLVGSPSVTAAAVVRLPELPTGTAAIAAAVVTAVVTAVLASGLAAPAVTAAALPETASASLVVVVGRVRRRGGLRH